MPGVVALVSAISADVVATLGQQGVYLSGGGILIGRVHLEENLAPPWIVFVPRGSRFEAARSPNRSTTTNPLNSRVQNPGAGIRLVQMLTEGQGYTTATASFSAPDIAGGTTPTATPNFAGGAIKSWTITNSGSGYVKPPTVTISGDGTGATAITLLAFQAERLSQLAARPLFTDVTIFEVHCWGQAAPPDADGDFDSAQSLYQQVIRSAHLCAPGVVHPKQGVWQDSKPGTTQLDLAGHYFVFTLEIETPIPDTPLSGAPSQVQPVITASISLAGGTPEQGFQG